MGRWGISFPSEKGTNPAWGPALMTPHDPNTSQRPRLHTPWQPRLGLQHMDSNTLSMIGLNAAELHT